MTDVKKKQINLMYLEYRMVEVQEDVTVQDKLIDVLKELISDVMDEDERR